MPRLVNLTSVIYSLSLLSAALAQIPTAFRWGWGETPPSGSLQECQKFQVTVGSLDSSKPHQVGVSPYYMLALEASGIPTTSLIGSDPSNLWWQADHSRGSTLMLAVVDSNGSTGGVYQTTYSMSAGSDTSCLSGMPSSTTTITANVSDSLTTCQPWGLSMNGGQMPYTLVFAQLSSNTLTFVTMGKNDDLLTYINRATPGDQLMASVYDGTGRWGTSTPSLNTTGDIEVDCGDLLTVQTSSSGGPETEVTATLIVNPVPSGTSVSPPSSTAGASSGTNTATTTSSSSSSSQFATAAPNPGSHTSVALIAGISAGVGVPVLLAIAAAIWFCTRRRNKVQHQTSPIDILQSPYPHSMGYMREADSTVNASFTPSSKSPMVSHSRQPSATAYPESAPFLSAYVERPSMVASASSRSSGFYHAHHPPRSATPTQSSDIATSARTQVNERQQDGLGDFNPYAVPLTVPGSSSALSSQNEKMRIANGRMNASASSKQGITGSLSPYQPAHTGEDTADPPSTAPEEIIVQHQDSGVTVVRELPPPYAGLPSRS